MNREQKLRRCCIIGIVAFVIAGILTPIADALGFLAQAVAIFAYAVTVVCVICSRVLKYLMDRESDRLS